MKGNETSNKNFIRIEGTSESLLDNAARTESTTPETKIFRILVSSKGI